MPDKNRTYYFINNLDNRLVMEKPKNGNLVYTSPRGNTVVLMYNQPWAVLQKELKNRLGTSGYTKENLKCKYLSKI